MKHEVSKVNNHPVMFSPNLFTVGDVVVQKLERRASDVKVESSSPDRVVFLGKTPG